MPLPAHRCRLVQAPVKTVMTPDLSLRGAKRRGALSAKREEVPLGCNLGKAVTLIAPAIVGERTAGPGDALTVRTSHRQNGKRFRFVIARRPTADVAP